VLTVKILLSHILHIILILNIQIVSCFCIVQGTSSDQDNRFSDKNKRLMKTMKFADAIAKKVICSM